MTEINDPKAVALATEAEHILAKAQTYTISTAAEYEAAADELKAIKAKYKEVESHRVLLKEPVLQATRRIDDFFRAPLTFLKNAEDTIKKAMITHQRAEEAKRQEAERAAREAARKEQERLDAEAAETRRKAEAKATELKRQAEEAEAAGHAAEAAKLAARAATTVEKAEAKAETLQQRAVSIPVPSVATQAPKVSGISTREVWRARVTNAMVVPREYLIVNEAMLDKIAKATKGAIQIPGVEFYAEETIAAKAG